MKATDLRPGYGVKIDDKLWVITNFEHRTPGNLRAFIQIKIKNVINGQIVERRLGSSDDVDVIDLDRRTMEYLYSDNTGATFMDIESYDQMVIPAKVLGDALKFLRPNSQTIVIMYDGNPISVELPPAVELTITDTTPGIKKATVTNVMKEATLETGLVTRVPDFIENGESIKIATSDGSYMSRA
jgi:elongation factor P